MLKSLSALVTYKLLNQAQSRKLLYYGSFVQQYGGASGIATKEAQEKSEAARLYNKYDNLSRILACSLLMKLGDEGAPKHVCRKCARPTWKDTVGIVHYSDCEFRSPLEEYFSGEYEIGGVKYRFIDYNENNELLGYQAYKNELSKKWFPKSVVDSARKVW